MGSPATLEVFGPMSIARRRRGPQPQPASWCALEGADDLEPLVDEDVVRPVDADVVNLVFAVGQLNNTVDDAARVGGQRSFRRPICWGSAHDRSRPLAVVRRDLTDLL